MNHVLTLGINFTSNQNQQFYKSQHILFAVISVSHKSNPPRYNSWALTQKTNKQKTDILENNQFSDNYMLQLNACRLIMKHYIDIVFKTCDIRNVNNITDIQYFSRRHFNNSHRNLTVTLQRTEHILTFSISSK